MVCRFWDTFYLISIHALHEESDAQANKTDITEQISIHALHEESDFHSELLDFKRFRISIHALHEESDSSASLSASRCVCIISIHALHEESDDSAAGHFCPLFETQASCLALSISNNTADTTNNMSKTSNWLSVSF